MFKRLFLNVTTAPMVLLLFFHFLLSRYLTTSLVLLVIPSLSPWPVPLLGVVLKDNLGLLLLTVSSHSLSLSLPLQFLTYVELMCVSQRQPVSDWFVAFAAFALVFSPLGGSGTTPIAQRGSQSWLELTPSWGSFWANQQTELHINESWWIMKVRGGENILLLMWIGCLSFRLQS